MRAARPLNQLFDPELHDAPEGHRALAFELAHVLQNWPDGVPAARRAQIALLLEKILLPLDRPTRQALAGRLGHDAAIPLSLSGILFFDAPRSVRDAILARHAGIEIDRKALVVDGAALIRAARDYSTDRFAQELARSTGIPLCAITRILGDVSGECLAILCRGIRLPRLVFSTIAVLGDVSLRSAEKKLELFDAVAIQPTKGLVQSWRASCAWQHGTFAEGPRLAPAPQASA